MQCRRLVPFCSQCSALETNIICFTALLGKYVLHAYIIHASFCTNISPILSFGFVCVILSFICNFHFRLCHSHFYTYDPFSVSAAAASAVGFGFSASSMLLLYQLWTIASAVGFLGFYVKLVSFVFLHYMFSFTICNLFVFFFIVIFKSLFI